MTKLRKNKLNIAVLSLFLILTIAVSLTQNATVKADDVETHMYITVSPSPVGVGQDVAVVFWLDKVCPTASAAAGDRWEGVTVEITDPNGDKETTEEFTLDASSSAHFTYTPDEEGTYTFQAFFPGQHVEGAGGFGGYYDNDYLESTSSKEELVVQAESIESWPYTPLPTEYWTRPINAENHGWGSISGNWLGIGTSIHGPNTYDEGGNYNPYTTAPNAAHVVWTKELSFGGIVGGEYGDVPYYTGESYERQFQPPVIIQGRLYYNQRLGSSSWLGTVCVDLRTGEELWFQEGVTITFGQVLDMETPNQHGAIAYLWSVSGTTYKMYDAFTGEWILDVANVSSGTRTFGPSGEILVYSISETQLTVWNSTLAVNPTIDSTWSWRPSQGATMDGNNGYSLNVTIEEPTGSITRVYGDTIYAYTGDTWIGYDRWTGEKQWDTDIDKATDDSAATTEFDPENEVLAEFMSTTLQWYGYNVTTGEHLWTTEPYTNDWGYYQAYCDSLIADGYLYATAYDGMVHCYDILTGNNTWNYYYGDSGLETVYGHYVAKDVALTIADGKVYAANNEHSPSTPFYRGCKLHCINATDGTGIWNITYMGLAPVIADGYAVAYNYLDGQLYCFGKGETATTVTASPKISTEGDAILIEGAVTDQSPATENAAAISDDDVGQWMEYLLMQQTAPENAAGVTVTISVLDPNGNCYDVATATTDINGFYSATFTPLVSGNYTVYATFSGSESYYSSSAVTAIGVEEAPAATAEPTPTPASLADTIILPGIIGIIAAIAVVGLVLILMLRKR